MSLTNRAPRYPLKMTIRFRPAGGGGWLEGETLNVSQSGILFRTSQPVPGLHETLEMALEMSALGPRIANVTCTGRLVRIRPAEDSSAVIAATVEVYHLTRSAV